MVRRGSILDPALLSDSTSFIASKKTNPRGKQPSRDKAASGDKEAFPNHQHDDSIGNRAAGNYVARHQHKEMQPADNKEPAEPRPIAPQKSAVSRDGIAQPLVMQR